MPAGDVKVALGVLYKHDKYIYEADPIGSLMLDDGSLDIVGFNASDDIEGSDHNVDVYAEAVVPLVAARPGIERLETVLGYRHSNYESAGGVDAYKAELLYNPVKSVTLRSSYQHAVRAPSVFELYQPQLPIFYFDQRDDGSPFDPCSVGSVERNGPNAAQVEALCLAQGMPATLLPDFSDADGEHTGVGGGNPEPRTRDRRYVDRRLRAQFLVRNPLLASMQSPSTGTASKCRTRSSRRRPQTTCPGASTHASIRGSTRTTNNVASFRATRRAARSSDCRTSTEHRRLRRLRHRYAIRLEPARRAGRC